MSQLQNTRYSIDVPAAQPRFFGQVMTWLAIAFAAAGAGTFILGPFIPASWVMPLSLLALGVLLVSAFVRKALPVIAGPLAIFIPVILGVTLYPLLNSMAAAGMGGIIVQALVGTAVVFTGMAIWGWTTTKDLSGWYKPMFFILLGIIAVSLLNVFVFQLGTLGLLISVGTLVLFSIYTMMDLQSVKNAEKHGTNTPPAVYALNIFLDIYNIFVSLLRILSAFR